MSATQAQRLDVLGQLDELNSCFDAISNLISPEPALDGSHRDNLSLLLNRLSSEQTRLLEQLRHL